MKDIIEISGNIENGMWDYRVFPELKEIVVPASITETAAVKENGFSISSITCSSLSGTYLESGAHLIEGMPTIDTYQLNDCIKPVKTIHLPDVKQGGRIDETQLRENAPGIDAGDALIIDTGWWRSWNTEGFVTCCPTYTREAMQWVIDLGLSIFGVDVPCIEAPDERGSLLRTFFATGALLAAPLVNLEGVPETGGFIGCFPLAVKGASGAPARIVYFED